MQDADAEQSTVQLIVDQLEELIVTVIEEIRARPSVAAAMLAAVVGIVVGSMLATRGAGGQSSPPARIAKRARGVGSAMDLAGLGMQLLQNPIVRGYLTAMLEKQLKQRLGR